MSKPRNQRNLTLVISGPAQVADLRVHYGTGCELGRMCEVQSSVLCQGVLRFPGICKGLFMACIVPWAPGRHYRNWQRQHGVFTLAHRGEAMNLQESPTRLTKMRHQMRNDLNWLRTYCLTWEMKQLDKNIYTLTSTCCGMLCIFATYCLHVYLLVPCLISA